MRTAAARIVVLVVSLSLVGCSSLRVIADGREASSRLLQQPTQELASGDQVVLTLDTGQKITLKISSVSPETIEGIEEGSPELVRVQVDQIDKIERREFDKSAILRPLRVIVAIAVLGGVIVGVAFAAGAIARSSVEHGLERR